MGQIVTWPQHDLLHDDPETPHAKSRKQATASYLSSARRPATRHQNQCKKTQKVFQVGDTVGIKIHNVDRTNTDSRILPCKVLKVREESPVPYQLYTNSGILQTKFSADELQDMKNVCFPDLNQADPNELKEISVIQACRNYSRWSSNPTTESLCSCNGSCITKRCRCRKNGLKCSTKCHHNSTCCQNKF